MAASAVLPPIFNNVSSQAGPRPRLLTLESSRRLSSGLSLHTFAASKDLSSSLHPSGHIDLRLHEDLDPTRRSQTSAESDRWLTLTPCYVKHGGNGGHHQVMILARNGRTTQLLGLPRSQGPLAAEIVSSGGGFPIEALEGLQGAVCVASGSGIASMMALCSRDFYTRGSSLIYTLNGNDFEALEFLLDSKMLKPTDWASVRVFVTAGDEKQGHIAGKPVAWWQDKLAALQQRICGNISFTCGRMNKQDMTATGAGSPSRVLFCGHKSLEWEVKKWCLNHAPVYTTSIM
ncbi:hypothetical protein LIA77_04106 [Sarocladium implicatum]|nr:hypothetical protein LIA77_04106 [Sarocladium implicatum]